MSSSFIIQKGPGIASKAYNYAKKLITGGPKVSPTITSVAPKFPKNKMLLKNFGHCYNMGNYKKRKNIFWRK